MAIETKQIEYAKEIDDATKLLVELVADLRAKKSISEIAAENIPNLLAALDGIDQVDDEFEENRKVALATVGYRAGELTDALLPQKSA